jgi:hypothetical protein
MPLKPEEARAVLNTWGAEKLLSLKGFGDRATIQSITDSSAHHLTLRTQYDTLSRDAAIAPAPPGRPTPLGPPPTKERPQDSQKALAEIQRITSLRSFSEATHEIVLRDSHRVAKCNKCAGAGHVRCVQCHGSGRTVCPWCGGAGSRNMPVSVPTRNAQGQMTMTTQLQRQPCTCFGGRVACGQCGSKGHTTCHDCAGHGSVHIWDTVTHKFESQTRNLFFNAGELSEQVVKSATGSTVWNDYYTQSSNVPGIPVPLQDQLHNLLATASNVSGADKKVLFHHLAVVRIPVHYVVYSVGKTSNAHLWIYGAERNVHAPSESGFRGLWNRLTR